MKHEPKEMKLVFFQVDEHDENQISPKIKIFLENIACYGSPPDFEFEWSNELLSILGSSEYLSFSGGMGVNTFA